MEQPADIQLLLIKMEQGTCSPEEAELISGWLAASGNHQAALSLLTAHIAAPGATDTVDAVYKERLEQVRHRIISGQYKPATIPVHRVHFLRRNGWAAAIFILLCTALWMLYRQPLKPDTVAGIQYKGDAAPGREGAVLTLADGKTILLDSVANGAITNEQGTAIEKTTNGSLSYATGTQANAAVFMNTLATPRARKFRMTLPDGSGVWLNAASTITFPSAFTGKERKVEVTGEVYFDVVTDKNKPFIVTAGKQDILVLGTSFNVNTYNNASAVITTLIEGSVQLTDGKKTQLLQPGEQATGFSIATANIPQTIAWKNGLFHFEGTDLKTIMDQISRWYDVDVVFDADAPSYDFTAKLPDNLPVSEVLKILEMTKLVHFDINGKTIIVKK